MYIIDFAQETVDLHNDSTMCPKINQETRNLGIETSLTHCYLNIIGCIEKSSPLPQAHEAGQKKYDSSEVH